MTPVTVIKAANGYIAEVKVNQNTNQHFVFGDIQSLFEWIMKHFQEGLAIIDLQKPQLEN